MLLIMAGLPGTGKTTLAQEVARRTGAFLLGKDPIRAVLFGDEVEHSAEQDDFVISIMLQTAAWVLARARNRVVILDGRVFSRNAQLQRVTDFADKLGIEWRVIECVCSVPTARRRLEQDLEDGTHIAGNRTFELYREVKQRFEPIPQPKRIIDTDRPLEECVQEVLQVVGG